MGRQRNPRQEYREACVIAQEHGLLIEQDARGAFQVWQPTEPKNRFLGKRSSPSGLRALVCNLTNFK